MLSMGIRRENMRILLIIKSIIGQFTKHTHALENR